MRDSRNFRVPNPNLQAKVRLAVFHHAGGSSLSFLRLARELSGECEVLFAEQPGRATRLHEPPLASIADFARACLPDLLSFSKGASLVLYGHSMGALVAYEAACLLASAGAAPAAWMVSSCNPPGSSHGPKQFLLQGMNLASEETLLQVQRAYGAFGPELNSPLLKSYFLPLLRADLHWIAGYRESGGMVPAPLVALGGASDPVVSPEDMLGWKKYTKKGFRQEAVSGGHFFPLQEGAPEFYAQLRRLFLEI